MALYASYLASLVNQPVDLLISAADLASFAFISISIWSLFGSAIRRYLRLLKVKLVVNISLALHLIKTVVALSGLLPAGFLYIDHAIPGPFLHFREARK